MGRRKKAIMLLGGSWCQELDGGDPLQVSQLSPCAPHPSPLSPSHTHTSSLILSFVNHFLVYSLVLLVRPYPAPPCPVFSYPTLSNPTLPCFFLPYPSLPYPLLPYPTLSCPALLCPTLSCPAPPLFPSFFPFPHINHPLVALSNSSALTRIPGSWVPTEYCTPCNTVTITSRYIRRKR